MLTQVAFWLKVIHLPKNTASELTSFLNVTCNFWRQVDIVWPSMRGGVDDSCWWETGLYDSGRKFTAFSERKKRSPLRQLSHIVTDLWFLGVEFSWIIKWAHQCFWLLFQLKSCLSQLHVTRWPWRLCFFEDLSGSTATSSRLINCTKTNGRPFWQLIDQFGNFSSISCPVGKGKHILTGEQTSTKCGKRSSPLPPEQLNTSWSQAGNFIVRICCFLNVVQ